MKAGSAQQPFHRMLHASLLATAIGAFVITASPWSASGIEYGLRGQLSGWLTGRRAQGSMEFDMGVRYIPQLEAALLARGENLLDLDISLSAFAFAGSALEEDADAELYRAKLRFATPQSEARIGLQKIDFGPAFLLRSLQWFDSLDPRDPVQLTDGVYGLRFMYSTLGNTSIWLWGLYGNDDTKGLELLATAGGRPELGARIQFPVPNGELAFTVHTRFVDASPVRSGALAEALFGAPVPAAVPVGDFAEDRFALDGRWDIEIGLWFESVFQHWRTGEIPIEWTKLTTLGADYTFGIGSGLYALVEHMAVATSESLAGWDRDIHTSAWSMSYQLGLLDRVQAIGFYLWDDDEYGQFLSWRRTWDTLVLDLNLFHYPETTGGGLAGAFGAGAAGSGVETGGEAPAGGYGGRIIVIINH